MTFQTPELSVPAVPSYQSLRSDAERLVLIWKLRLFISRTTLSSASCRKSSPRLILASLLLVVEERVRGLIALWSSGVRLTEQGEPLCGTE